MWVVVWMPARLARTELTYVQRTVWTHVLVLLMSVVTHQAHPQTVAPSHWVEWVCVDVRE